MGFAESGCFLSELLLQRLSKLAKIDDKVKFYTNLAVDMVLIPQKQLRQSHIDAIIFPVSGLFFFAQLSVPKGALRLTVGLAQFVSLCSQTSPSRRTLAVRLKDNP